MKTLFKVLAVSLFVMAPLDVYARCTNGVSADGQYCLNERGQPINRFTQEVIELGPNESCRWAYRESVRVSAAACGGQEKVVCSGRVVCSNEFQLNGQSVGRGAYALSCASPSGYCNEISMADCMVDTETEPLLNQAPRDILGIQNTIESAVQ